MSEIWKQVDGFEGMYEVSNEGNVRSIRCEYPIVLKKQKINSGYEKVNFKIRGKSHNRLVHRLVAKAFCNGYADGLDVNHKDANRLNNRAENLEWVTRIDNIRDSMKRGTHSVSEAHAVAQEKRKRPVIQFDKDFNEIASFESAREAAKSVGVHENCISRVCRGERKYSAGFAWAYIDSR